jgi:hypothetical protein
LRPPKVLEHVNPGVHCPAEREELGLFGFFPRKLLTAYRQQINNPATGSDI